MEKILEEIRTERLHQEKKWGSLHDDAHSCYAWVSFIVMYAGKAVSHIAKEMGTQEMKLSNFRYNLVKIAAISIAAIEAVDRKNNNV